MTAPEPRTIAVPYERVRGWTERYDAQHPDTTWSIGAEHVRADSPDGSWAAFDIPFAPLGDTSAGGLAAHLEQPRLLGMVIVRKGGFAVARVEGAKMVESKVGQRHVQSRTKAGGWSQQRFARRRENQAREAYDAASGYVHEILLPHAANLALLVTAGDRAAVDAVFGFRALSPLLGATQQWIPGIPDPTRAVLEQVVQAARSVEISIVDVTR